MIISGADDKSVKEAKLPSSSYVVPAPSAANDESKKTETADGAGSILKNMAKTFKENEKRNEEAAKAAKSLSSNSATTTVADGRRLDQLESQIEEIRVAQDMQFQALEGKMDQILSRLKYVT